MDAFEGGAKQGVWVEEVAEQATFLGMQINLTFSKIGSGLG